MAFDYPTNITALRKLAEDTPTSNHVPQETPAGKRDGANVLFKLAYDNIVTGSVFLTTGATVRTQAGFTVAVATGFVTFAAAPSGNENPWFVDYYFQWATDAEYTTFLDQALENVGAGAGNAPDAKMLPAVMQFALSAALNARAIQYARKYSASGGIAGQQVDVVTQNFRNLAKDAWQRAVDLLEAATKRQGRRNVPASAVFNYNIDPGSPRR